MCYDLLKTYWLEDSGVRFKSNFTDFSIRKKSLTSSKDNVKIISNTSILISHCDLLENCFSIVELENIIKTSDFLEIKKEAKNTVFADGKSEKPDLMIIGEAPGEQEDLRGIPFCGQSGSLLDSMLRAIGLNRKDVYITNVVFWRPPMNRRPNDSEIEACRPFVFKHIELVRPRYILLLGATALKSVLKISSPMGVVRREILSSEKKYLLLRTRNASFPVFVSYHPSYLLRSPLQKKESWKDFKNIKALLSC